MNLKDLENKRFDELTNEERSFIRDEYLKFFDRFMVSNPRRRAIGYCVIAGGIPTNRIGELDVVFKRVVKDFPPANIHRTKVNVTLYWRGCELPPWPKDENGTGLYAAIFAYMATDKRFAPYLPRMDGTAPDDMPERVQLPLFVITKPKKREKGSRLNDCRVTINSASKAIGFKTGRFHLSQLGNALHPEDVDPSEIYWYTGRR